MNIDKIVKGQAVKLRINHLTGNLSEFECRTFLNNFSEAINNTPCCKSDSEQLQGFFDYYKQKFGGGFQTDVLEITLKQYEETL